MARAGAAGTGQWPAACGFDRPGVVKRRRSNDGGLAAATRDAPGKRAAGHAIRPRRPPSCVSAAPPATHDQSIPTRLRFSLRWALLHTAARLLHALDAKLRRADLRRLQGGDAPGKPACETRALAPLACSALLLDLSCVASNSLALAMFPGANMPTYHTTNARPEPVVDSNGSDPCLAPPVRRTFATLPLFLASFSVYMHIITAFSTTQKLRHCY